MGFSCIFDPLISIGFILYAYFNTRQDLPLW
jgi:hypothetical protein